MSPISDSIFAAVITSIPGMVIRVQLNVDKRYVPNYALRQRPSQGGLSLSASLTSDFTSYSPFGVVVF